MNYILKFASAFAQIPSRLETNEFNSGNRERPDRITITRMRYETHIDVLGAHSDKSAKKVR